MIKRRKIPETLIAVFCTYNEDGTIHTDSVWFKYEIVAILFGIQEVSRKIRNLQRNRHVTVLIDTHDPPYKGV